MGIDTSSSLFWLMGVEGIHVSYILVGLRRVWTKRTSGLISTPRADLINGAEAVFSAANQQ